MKLLKHVGTMLQNRSLRCVLGLKGCAIRAGKSEKNGRSDQLFALAPIRPASSAQGLGQMDLEFARSKPVHPFAEFNLHFAEFRIKTI
jgi:hypothetical protein